MRLLLLAILFLPLVHAQERCPVISTRDAPVKIEKKAEGHWFIDFGNATFGNVEITATNTPAAKTIVHLGEKLSGPAALDRSPGGSVRYQQHPLALRAGSAVTPPLTWSPPSWMKDGWLTPPKPSGVTMPFRYVEIENGPTRLEPKDIVRISWHTAFDDNAATFESSSPELDAVWQLCKHSVKATTFMGLYVDGDRERRPYEADVLINQLSHYGVDASYEIARLSVNYLLKNPTWPTEWRLQSNMLAWNDFLYSGDDSSLAKNYAVLKSRAMIERRDPTGFFLGTNGGEIRDIVDWPAVERDGYDMSPAIKTAVTAFHYRSLVLLAKIATQLGKTRDAAEFTEMAATTYKSVNERLWDETRGCYIDGLDAAGHASAHASAHANFFPLALGLVPANRVARVGDFLKSRGMACSVYGAQFLLEALYDAGESEQALALLSSRDTRSWLNMTEKVGSTVTLEAWDPSLKPNLDWNHAWGTAPANLIPRKLMGIEPLQPGFKIFRVRPQTASLTRAKIKTPTPRGPVLLAISRAADSWTAEITIPVGTAAEFHLPVHDPATLALSSGTPRILREENGRVVIGLLPGTHKISLKPTTP